jgi:heavy metal sensor kinase
VRAISIRMRLTLWYSSILAVTFVLLGSGLFYEMRRGLCGEIDLGLNNRLDSLQSFLESTKPLRWAAELDEEYEEKSAAGSAGELMQIRGKSGKWSYQSPAIRRLKISMRDDVGQKQFARILSGEHAFRTLTAPIRVDGEVYTVMVAVDAGQVDAALARFAWLLVGAIPVALALASGGGFWMSRRALRQVDKITESARSISASNLANRLEEPGTGDEIQRLTETLNEMLGRLDQSFQKITQFTADASHELRTPVTVIRTAAELALRRPQADGEYRETLQQILEEAERTTGLIEGLMILARSDSGSEVFLADSVDLCSIVAGVVRKGKTLAEAKNIEFSTDIPDSPIEIIGDAEKLSRLFLILVDNAVKYTPAAGRVNVRVGVREGRAIVAIQDSGIGICQEDLPNIFERFYRADKARSRELDGFGLGLAIAKSIADAHKAVIQVESANATGSTFTVALPLF